MAAGVVPPIFVQLQADCARANLILKSFGQRRFAFACEAEVHRQIVNSLEHQLQILRAGRARRRVRPGRRAGTAANKGSARRWRALQKLVADKCSECAYRFRRR